MNSRLLLADNDPALRDISRQFFLRHGFAVETAADGVECLNKLRAFRPDVLMLEWEMPWGGGEGVLALLRDERALLPLDVIVVSSSGDRLILTERHPIVVACLPKPFSLNRLLRLARRKPSESLDKIPGATRRTSLHRPLELLAGNDQGQGRGGLPGDWTHPAPRPSMRPETGEFLS